MFHYPPKPKDFGYKATPFTIDHELLDPDSSTDSEVESTEDERLVDDTPTGRGAHTSNYVSGQTLLDLLDEQDRKRTARASKAKKSSVSSTQRANSDIGSLRSSEPHRKRETKVFGFEPEFLSEMVTPPRQLCNSRSEITVDDMAFLGLPIHVNEEGQWRTHAKTAKHSKTSRLSKTSTNEGEEHVEERTDSDTMSMFNVVFVMNPPVVEYQHRLDEMYHYIVSRLALVLRYEQAKSNYVWLESHKILKLKEQLEDISIYELYANILAESSLAQIIAQCFDSISTSNIANLQVQDKMISLQIPLKTQFKSLPPKTVQVLPGSYLSSTAIDANSSEDEEQNIGFMALLLLDEPDVIITELKTEPGSPLAHFILSIHPTLSLFKLAQHNKMDHVQLASFAKHLIYWRRARAVVPLHPKSVFIVSPMAPLDRISDKLKPFKQQFPPLPSLSSFLSLLSNTKPRPYATIIPSKDHRDIYMDALAWLIRHGFVTQLLTFVWLKIPNRVTMTVEEELEKEGLTNKSKDSKFKVADISTDATGKDKDGKRSGFSSSSQMKRFWNGQEMIIEEAEEEDTILLDPERATAVERRWIGKIVKGQPPELVALFHKLVKYFNGKTPLELVMVKENIARHDVKRLLHGINDFIISVKHW